MTLLIPNDVLELIFEAYSFVGGILLVLFPVILLLFLTRGMKDDKVKPIKGLIFILAGVLAMGLAAELAYAYTYGWEHEMADWIEFSGAIMFIVGLIMLIGSINVGGQTLGSRLFGGGNDNGDGNGEVPDAGAGPEADENNPPEEIDNALNGFDALLNQLYNYIEQMRSIAIDVLQTRFVIRQLENLPNPTAEQQAQFQELSQNVNLNMMDTYQRLLQILFTPGEGDQAGLLQQLYNHLEALLNLQSHNRRTAAQGLRMSGLLTRMNRLLRAAFLIPVQFRNQFDEGSENPRLQLTM